MIDAKLEHPQRRILNDEVHARPPDSIGTPASVSYFARRPSDQQSPGTGNLARLLEQFGQQGPERESKHHTATVDSAHLRWERHTEYSRYTLVRDGASKTPFADMPSDVLPDDWVNELEGEILVAVHALVISLDDYSANIETISRDYFDGNMLIGSVIADGRGVALTDLRIHGDGYSRILLVNLDMNAEQTGRLLQRLLEIETYRIMALLALPVAQRLSPELDKDEEKLEEIGSALLSAAENQEQILLGGLSELSATTQHRHLESNYRFAAADAYYEIVLQRITELREERILGLQTFEEFTTRRLTPAVRTYRAVARRQQSVLEQIARATKLLSTRIDVTRQRQNQSLLESMNRRVRAQLRMQATVEGLSVAAVTYYVSGLVNILAKSGAEAGLPINATVVTGVSIPFIAATVYSGVRRMRRKISAEEGE